MEIKYFLKKDQRRGPFNIHPSEDPDLIKVIEAEPALKEIERLNNDVNMLKRVVGFLFDPASRHACPMVMGLTTDQIILM